LAHHAVQRLGVGTLAPGASALAARQAPAAADATCGPVSGLTVEAIACLVWRKRAR